MMDDDEPFEYDSDVEEAVGGTDEEDQDADSDGSKREVETIVIDDDSDEELQAPPEPLHKPFKGKLSSRKQYLADVEALAEELGSPNGVHVKSEWRAVLEGLRRDWGVLADLCVFPFLPQTFRSKATSRSSSRSFILPSARGSNSSSCSPNWQATRTRTTFSASPRARLGRTSRA